MTYESKDIRNVSVIGHAGCGKTSLIEHLLFKTGMTSRIGRSSDGTSILDVASDEKARQGSIDSAVAHLDHDGMHLNLLDTPGLLDFANDSLGSLAAVEGCLVLVDAKSGPKVTTRRLWQATARRGLPRIIAVSRLDQPDTDFDAIVASIQETFGEKCMPIFQPNASGSGFSSVEDVINVENEALVEAVVECDDDLMERYLEDGEISLEELVATMKKAALAGDLYPIVPIASEVGEGVGLDELLRALRVLMPSPLERGHTLIVGGKEKLHDPTSSAFSGVCFKSMHSDAGRLSFVRVMSGELRSGRLVENLSRGESERGVHLFRMQGKERDGVDVAVAGDIVVIPKADSLHIGDTIGDKGFEGRFKPVAVPEPMVRLAIVPKSRADASKLLDGLRRVADDCKSFQFNKDATTGDLIVSGNSRTHLDIMLGRLQTRSRLEVEHKPPRIPYRETITAKADEKYRHKKQSGGSGEFGEVWMRIEPTARDEGFAFVSEVVGGSISATYLPSIEKGVKDIMSRGVVAGYPVVDVKVVVYDGKEHAVDSKDVAFQKAGRGAFKKCIAGARPVMLEPIVKIEVNVPNDNVGDVTADLASTRRGQITGTEYEGQFATIAAHVPLASVSEYDAQLRSMTAGEGSYTLEPSHYDLVPGNVQQELAAQFTSDDDD